MQLSSIIRWEVSKLRYEPAASVGPPAADIHTNRIRTRPGHAYIQPRSVHLQLSSSKVIGMLTSHTQIKKNSSGTHAIRRAWRSSSQPEYTVTWSLWRCMQLRKVNQTRPRKAYIQLRTEAETGRIHVAMRGVHAVRPAHE
jgi:hypothetical protein